MEYEIKGGNFPIVLCKLNKGEVMKNESGSMATMTSEITMSSNTGGGIIKGLGRALAGDSLFLNFFTADDDNQEIGFASSFPGEIIPFELSDGKTIVAQKSAFLASEENVEIDIFFNKKLGAGLFGGEGFILQKLSGEGTAFLEVDGGVIEKTLAEGEKLVIDQGHLAAMDETVDFDIQRVKGLKNIVFGGEGLFLTTLTGPGKVYLQTMPLSNFINLLAAKIPSSN
ncbi:hypothetical protein MBCUT_13200 [Methanobrevibacter cuticularis]|uniref:TIGR00266 family protein n=1 Tax=Methanobrevibacter cuticularis TaxID=47311 RepID=A0A166DPD7_9EURY|nr:TIGR00266 family protein [Methanobrevibacter cuticularis]KZX15816.1 hypothetical protein MBCUT_13200 [Methanobrevibacter cuticularis]